MYSYFLYSTRRRRNRWSQAAVDALIKGVNKYGAGKWKLITYEEYSHVFPTENNVAIKDKWRNLIKYGHKRIGPIIIERDRNPKLMKTEMHL